MVARPLRLQDAEILSRAGGDTALRRWTNIPDPFTVDEARKSIAEALQAWMDGTVLAQGVFNEETGDLIGGAIARRSEHDSGVGDLGGWVAPWQRARRYGIKGYRLCAKVAFEQLGFHHLTARVEYGNYASRAVVEGIGYEIVTADDTAFGGRGAWLAELAPDRLIGADGELNATARRCLAFGVGARRRLRVQAGDDVLTLRPPGDADIDAILATHQDPQTRRWTRVEEASGIAEAEYFVRGYAWSMWARQTGAVFAIADAEDCFIGAVELLISADDPALGIAAVVVAPTARGRGYAPAALRGLANWGFEALGLARIEAGGDQTNIAALRTAEKAGFIHEGVRRDAWLTAGKRSDAFVVGLVPADLR